MTVPNVAVDTIVDPDWGNQVADAINTLLTDLAALSATMSTEQGYIDTLQAAVTAIQANNWVTTARILDSAVATAKLANLAVTTAKLNDLAVTAAKIADATITPGKLASSVLSGAWETIGDTGSNWTGESSTFKLLGNVVFWQFQGTLAGVGHDVILSSSEVPAEYRPSGTKRIPGSNSTNGKAYIANVASSGEITVSGGNFDSSDLGVFAFSGIYAV